MANLELNVQLPPSHSFQAKGHIFANIVQCSLYAMSEH